MTEFLIWHEGLLGGRESTYSYQSSYKIDSSDSIYSSSFNLSLFVHPLTINKTDKFQVSIADHDYVNVRICFTGFHGLKLMIKINQNKKALGSSQVNCFATFEGEINILSK